MKSLFVILLIALLAMPIAGFAQDEDTEEIPEGFATFTNEDETVTFIHPEDWFVSDLGISAFALTTDEGLMESGDVMLETGEAIITILMVPSSQLSFLVTDVDLESETLYEDVANGFVAVLQEDEEVTYGDPELVEVEDSEFAYYRSAVEDQDPEGAVYVYRLQEDVFVVMFAAYAEGEFEDEEETVLLILESLEFTGDPDELFG